MMRHQSFFSTKYCITFAFQTILEESTRYSKYTKLEFFKNGPVRNCEKMYFSLEAHIRKLLRIWVWKYFMNEIRRFENTGKI